MRGEQTSEVREDQGANVKDLKSRVISVVRLIRYHSNPRRDAQYYAAIVLVLAELRSRELEPDRFLSS